MKMNKFKNKKIQETKLHAIPRFPELEGIICGPHRRSFAVQDHLRSNLRVISGRGSFAVLYSYLCSYDFNFSKQQTQRIPFRHSSTINTTIKGES